MKDTLLKKVNLEIRFLHGEDKPFFAEAGLYRIPAGRINPVEPWKLEHPIESAIPSENKKSM